MADWNQMSLLEAAEQILLQSTEPMAFLELFLEVCKVKGISEEERNEIISQVYADFVTSAKFVYVGDDQWDLKSRQSIDLWDKDGAFYQEYPDYEEDIEDEEEDEEDDFEEDDLDDEEEDEEDEDELEEDEFEDEYEDDLDYDDFDDEEEDFIEDEDDIVIEEEDFDDEKYNEYMDDYEKMYDE